MGHFYYRDEQGLDQPLYEVPYKDPSKGMRSATLGDARKLNGLPSPNTIMGVLAKPGIQWWSDDLLIDATRQLTVAGFGITEVEIKSAARELHKEWKEAAANEGTAIHDDIEHAVLKMLGRIDSYTPNQDVDPRITGAALDWLKAQDWAIEEVEAIFTNPVVGYGGKIDLTATKGYNPATFIIADWKSTNTKGKPLNGYPKDKTPLLAAYAMGFYGDLDVECWNVFLSRDEPGRIEPVKYSRDEIEWGWKKFQLCYELWVMENDYDPRNNGGVS